MWLRRCTASAIASRKCSSPERAHPAFPGGQADIAGRSDANETGTIRVLDRTAQALSSAVDTVRPGETVRRVRRWLSLRLPSRLFRLWRREAPAAVMPGGRRPGGLERENPRPKSPPPILPLAPFLVQQKNI